jgi:dTDP-4-amino-4,6-dideoxy-D-galactose acyltransferase
MITIARFESVGQIGLIAVNDRHQGKGVGSLLMNAARDWMIEAGVAVGRVVTQQDNRDACKLYERHGYSVIDTVYVYHFWLA